jgi:hypothetical protein
MIVKRVLLGQLFTALVFLSANASVSPVRNFDIANTTKTDVKFKGIDSKNMLGFQVKYANPSGKAFDFVVRDAYNEVIFRETYTTTDFNKTIKLEKDEFSALSFSIEDTFNNVIEKYNVQLEPLAANKDVVIKKG